MGLIFGSMGIVLIMWLIILALFIVYLVANCKMIGKTGEASWKGIIPIYEDYLKCKYAGCKSLFWKRFWLSIGMVIIPSIVSGIIAAVAGWNAMKFMWIPFILMLAMIVILFWFSVNCNIHIANAWGGNKWKAIALFSMPFIAIFIIGFDKTPYIGEDLENNEIMSLSEVITYLFDSDVYGESTDTSQEPLRKL